MAGSGGHRDDGPADRSAHVAQRDREPAASGVELAVGIGRPSGADDPEDLHRRLLSREPTAGEDRCAPPGVAPATGPAGLGRVPTLSILVAVFVSNQACRAMPCYLVDFGEAASPERAMNLDIGFGPAEYGFFATLCFTLPFMVASLAAGVLADSANRMRLGGVAALAWSACTASMACSTTFASLALQRGALGAAQAATNPASLSLIADLFPESRATTSAIFGLGIYVGTGVASLGAALNEHAGWRGTCVVFGLASASLSLPAFLAEDTRLTPPRSSSSPRMRTSDDLGEAAALPPGLWARLNAIAHGMRRAVLAVPRRAAEATATNHARWLFLAASLRFCCGFAILVWLPAAMRVRFPDDVARFAVLHSLIKTFAGGASSMGGGLASDVLRAWGWGDSGSAAFCALASLAAAPLWCLVLREGLSFEAAMAYLFAEYVMAESWLGPAVATLHSAVPPERRGAAQGVFSSLTALGNLLPCALGFLSAERLAAGLQVSVSVCYVLSGACFAKVAVGLRASSSAAADSVYVSVDADSA